MRTDTDDDPLVRAIVLVVLLAHRLAFVLGKTDHDPGAVVGTDDLIREAEDFIRDATTKDPAVSTPLGVADSHRLSHTRAGVSKWETSSS
jgi:hypothetical protein